MPVQYSALKELGGYSITSHGNQYTADLLCHNNARPNHIVTNSNIRSIGLDLLSDKYWQGGPLDVLDIWAVERAVINIQLL